MPVFVVRNEGGAAASALKTAGRCAVIWKGWWVGVGWGGGRRSRIGGLGGCRVGAGGVGGGGEGGGLVCVEVLVTKVGE